MLEGTEIYHTTAMLVSLHISGSPPHATYPEAHLMIAMSRRWDTPGHTRRVSVPRYHSATICNVRLGSGAAARVGQLLGNFLTHSSSFHSAEPSFRTQGAADTDNAGGRSTGETTRLVCICFAGLGILLSISVQEPTRQPGNSNSTYSILLVL